MLNEISDKVKKKHRKSQSKYKLVLEFQETKNKRMKFISL